MKPLPTIHCLIVGMLMMIAFPDMAFGKSGNESDLSRDPVRMELTDESDKGTDGHPGSAEDIKSICQLIIDLPALDGYYHVEEVPGRAPLRVLKNNAIRVQPELNQFGQRVEYVSREQAARQGIPYLEFTRIEIGADKATVNFRYPVEGVIGKVLLEKRQGNWAVKDQKLAETDG